MKVVSVPNELVVQCFYLWIILLPPSQTCLIKLPGNTLDDTLLLMLIQVTLIWPIVIAQSDLTHIKTIFSQFCFRIGHCEIILSLSISQQYPADS